MRVGLGVALAVLFPAVAAAHGVAAPFGSDPRVFSLWDQAALAALTVLGVLYVIGFRELHARYATRSLLEPTAFVIGWLALIAAVLPWFDAAAISQFSAHMAQHELMMLIGAPLVVAGRPLATCLWALPAQWRRRVAIPLQTPSALNAVRAMTSPVVAWSVHGIVVWAWHAPALYELAVRSEAVHAVQHAMFVTTSMLFWWGLVYGRYGRAGYGAAVFYVFTTAVHTGILGALFTLAPAPIYAVYARLGGDHALADQQVAGLVMWVPAGLLLTMMGLWLFAAWLGEAERRTRVPEAPPSTQS